MNLFNIPANELLQHILNGLTLGAIYSLIALGYTMVYGILKFINFAHGEIFMLGAYSGYYLYYYLCTPEQGGSWVMVSFILALIFAMVLSASIGMLIERVAYRPLRRAPRLAPLLSAIGVSIILMNLAALAFGTEPKNFSYPFDNSVINIGATSITPNQIMILAVGLVMMAGLKFFVDRTKLGKAMRATSQNQNVASLMGINVNVIISLTFAIGSALAAVAGVMIAMEYKVYPSMGQMAGLKAFIAAVAGGIGNISGAMIGGILLGLLETFGVVILGIPQGMKDTIAFSILIIILLVKPSGILIRNIREKV